MPRRARSRGGARGSGGAPEPTPDVVEEHPDGEFAVRPVPGSHSTKTYRGPGCDPESRPATPHVVVWPVGREDERRHWHRACWQARNRRRVRPHRTRNTPHYG